MVRGEEGAVVKRLAGQEIVLYLANNVGDEPGVVVVRQSVSGVNKGRGVNK